MTKVDHYKTLGVQRDADTATITKAFRKLARVRANAPHSPTTMTWRTCWPHSRVAHRARPLAQTASVAVAGKRPHSQDAAMNIPCT